MEQVIAKTRALKFDSDQQQTMGNSDSQTENPPSEEHVKNLKNLTVKAGTLDKQYKSEAVKSAAEMEEHSHQLPMSYDELRESLTNMRAWLDSKKQHPANNSESQLMTTKDPASASHSYELVEHPTSTSDPQNLPPAPAMAPFSFQVVNNAPSDSNLEPRSIESDVPTDSSFWSESDFGKYQDSPEQPNDAGKKSTPGSQHSREQSSDSEGKESPTGSQDFSLLPANMSL
ncbi:hypothetical protein F4808DRAFT_463713 [Astrocystis sublimbata]|nr:hypothetical protein F4808DRAFT_463713 [Astrocystis sublimbata]